MKCIAAILLLALAAVAMTEGKSLEPGKVEIAPENAAEAARNKRGLLLGATYTEPVAFSGYTSPAVAYTSAYSYPYAYAAYSASPYYSTSYSAPYYETSYASPYYVV